MRNFYNTRDNIVSDALDGLIAARGGEVLRFDHSSHARVVIRGGSDKSKVAVVSGGGSGHEPAHAGLVGAGLLTAAVCGDVFASPSVDAVLSAIIAVTGPAGCILVVKNYTGDRLNFGLAAEKAKALGLRVEMVIVADDIAIRDAVQPRGVAGTVFVHKIAGYLADAGRSLGEIVSVVERAKRGILTIGAARDTCTVPGSPKQERMADGEVEIGLGIHGEAGVELVRPQSSVELVEMLASRLQERLDPGARYALLFNNLGGLSGLECSVLLADVMRSRVKDRIAYVAGPASVMTALDMPGFSLSLLELTPEFEEILLAPTGCPALPPFTAVRNTTAIATPAMEQASAWVPSTDETVRKIVEAIVETCIAMESDINDLDAKVGDGDTGSTFATAARAVRRNIDALPFASGAALLSALSEIKRKAMGGSSGVLFAILLARAAEAYGQKDDWTAALTAGVEAMQKYGGARIGDRTMVDALKPAFDTLAAGGDLKVAAAAARKGADATAGMLRAGAGRSSYLDARSLEGNKDPGAEAVARVFETLAMV
ncbi:MULTISPECIES: dihydroxyacetone kinase subunit DhaK [unclassified Ensifer]|uniref:dihydroxyacetone kinase subunit DhaK n=1 Tax=unclassified Ensifer TaxID=2633371 RepID=UPI0008138386|nr:MULTISPECIES: dihydroxyacetone kinase subunit DhaK [unclassified Ensifer]OCP23577.1 dihydroxyacetone kinase [Ensifer sp. LC384]OCP24264.1 dihydroxyacetone kinase [Ensifer sp. LC54]